MRKVAKIQLLTVKLRRLYQLISWFRLLLRQIGWHKNNILPQGIDKVSLFPLRGSQGLFDFEGYLLLRNLFGPVPQQYFWQIL